jgi:hypothetical protein
VGGAVVADRVAPGELGGVVGGAGDLAEEAAELAEPELDLEGEEGDDAGAFVSAGVGDEGEEGGEHEPLLVAGAGLEIGLVDAGDELVPGVGAGAAGGLGGEQVMEEGVTVEAFAEEDTAGFVGEIRGVRVAGVGGDPGVARGWRLAEPELGLGLEEGAGAGVSVGVEGRGGGGEWIGGR